MHKTRICGLASTAPKSLDTRDHSPCADGPVQPACLPACCAKVSKSRRDQKSKYQPHPLTSQEGSDDEDVDSALEVRISDGQRVVLF